MDDDDWDNENDGDELPSTLSKNDSTLIGPKGDFVTAPEVSHVFGHCICVWLVTQWQSLNKPSGVQLVELGPGRGTLMTDILQLATSSKLSDFGETVKELHLVEASRELRQQQQNAMQKGVGHLIDFEFVNPPPIMEKASNDESEDKKDPEKKAKYK